MARTALTIEQILALLEDTPRRIAALTRGLTPAQLRRAPEPGEWSVNDVLAHLRSAADARGEFICAMLAEERPTLRAIDPDTVLARSDYRDIAFEPSFRAFRGQRARLVKFLAALPPAGWSRTAIVTGGGPPRERTVQFYAQWLARHEPAHVKQIERTVRTVAPKAASHR